MKEGVDNLIEYIVTPHLKREPQQRGDVKIYLPEEIRKQLNGILMECFSLEGVVPQISKYTGEVDVIWWQVEEY